MSGECNLIAPRVVLRYRPRLFRPIGCISFCRSFFFGRMVKEFQRLAPREMAANINKAPVGTVVFWRP